MSLYLKYRPASVDELDLTHVRKAIEQIVEKGELSHAYLFDGPRGSGKTSAARILAKIANCEENEGVGEPCGECRSCKAIEKGSAVDLVEIDAASNRGIDDIRDLKQKIKLAPSNLRYKVYIIDEVHMLTKEAFNALLKTLEEPPEHALFALCTTEPQRLPETIVSRCTRLKFRKANKEEMMRSLRRVVEGEKMKVEEEALEFLAGQVDGSFRDGVKVLDQVVEKDKKITKEMVEKVLYGVAGYDPQEFVEAMLEKEVKEGLRVVRKASEAGLDMEHFLRSGMYLVRDGMLKSLGVEKGEGEFEVGKEGVKLVREMDRVLSHLSDSSTPDLLVEMMVIDWCGDEGFSKEEDSGEEEEEEEKEERLGSESENKKGSGKKKVNGKTRGKIQLSKKEVREGWQRFLKRVNGNYSLGALLSSARIGGLKENVLVVKVAYGFHKKQLESPRFYRKVRDLVGEVYDEEELKVKFELDERGRKKEEEEEEEEGGESEREDELMKTAEEIFGA